MKVQTWHDEGDRLATWGTLDPRWEWVEVRRLCDVSPSYVKGRCLHTEVVPVEAGGRTVAHLCLTCDTQLPEGWRP